MTNKNIEKWEVSKAMVEYFMPYSLKVICDRALPDIKDGFKPVHRRILWKMFYMGAFSHKERHKSMTVVGEVMKIHGHGDTSISDALAMLTEQQEGQITPYIDGEGAFGKQYLADPPSAPRYTFCRLNKFTEDELMKDVKKGVVKMIGEGEHSQPVVLPSTYPNIIVKQNEGIAVGMSCYFPSHNLKEVCLGTVAYIEDPNVDLLNYIKAPDFASGGQLIYDETEVRKIINEGRGKLKVRSKYRYDEANNVIEVYEIPHNTNAKVIVTQITDMIKNGVKEVKDIIDARNESAFNKERNREELEIAIEVKKNTDVKRLMSYLFAKTHLEKSFSANMNCLVDFKPRVLGIKAILDEWLKFRRECIVKSIEFDLGKMEKDLHFLKGLEKVLLDIDKAIDIIRKSEEDEIAKNLMDFFKVDEIQAEEIANMKLRFINKQYILNKIKTIEELDNNIIKLKSKIQDVNEINKDIIAELKAIADKYGKPRRTEILYEVPDDVAITREEFIQNYNVAFFYTREGYLKKIPLTSLRSSGEHRLKDGDEIIRETQGQNTDEILVFTNKGNIHRIKAHKIDDHKTSTLGLYLPTELGLKGENIIDVIPTSYADGESVALFYDNGYVARVDIKAYQSNYTILKGNTNCKLIKVEKLVVDMNVMLISSEGKALIFNTNEINTISSRSAKGVKGMNLGENTLVSVIFNPKSKMKLALTTDKKGTFVEKTSDFVYYEGRRGNVGVFILNCRKNSSTLLSAEICRN